MVTVGGAAATEDAIFARAAIISLADAAPTTVPSGEAAGASIAVLATRLGTDVRRIRTGCTLCHRTRGSHTQRVLGVRCEEGLWCVTAPCPCLHCRAPCGTKF